MEYIEDGNVVSYLVVDWMNVGFGLLDKFNVWVGFDYWKYRNF